MDILAIRQEMGRALAGIDWQPAWKVYDTIPGEAFLPCLVVRAPDDIRYNRSFGGSTDATFTVVVVVAVVDDTDVGQQRLDQAMSWPGVVAPLQAHEAPLTVWRSLAVERAGNVRQVLTASGAVEAYAFDLTVAVST